VVKLTVEPGLFSGGPVEVLLEAHDRKNNLVGEARPGGSGQRRDAGGGGGPGTTEQVTLRMVPEFEGKFSVKALSPATLTVYAKLDLETDYTV
jgi:hypothetical protein